MKLSEIANEHFTYFSIKKRGRTPIWGQDETKWLNDLDNGLSFKFGISRHFTIDDGDLAGFYCEIVGPHLLPIAAIRGALYFSSHNINIDSLTKYEWNKAEKIDGKNFLNDLHDDETK
jgi:hypothetical protein